jgi:hypothetical protein
MTAAPIRGLDESGAWGAVALLELALRAPPVGWFRRAWSWIVELLRPSASADERRLERAFVRISRRVGAPLLAARSPEETAALIDASLADQELFALFFDASRLATIERVQALIALPAPPVEVINVLGAPHAERLLAGFRLAGLSGVAGLNLMATLSEDGSLDAIKEKMRNPLAYADDPAIPRLVRESILDSLRTLPVLVALARATAMKRPLPDWLARELTETFERGHRSHLRFLASIPAASVPEAVIPPGERLNLHALEREHTDDERRYQEALVRARAGGQGIYPV